MDHHEPVDVPDDVAARRVLLRPSPRTVWAAGVAIVALLVAWELFAFSVPGLAPGSRSWLVLGIPTAAIAVGQVLLYVLERREPRAAAPTLSAPAGDAATVVIVSSLDTLLRRFLVIDGAVRFIGLTEPLLDRVALFDGSMSTLPVVMAVAETDTVTLASDAMVTGFIDEALVKTAATCTAARRTAPQLMLSESLLSATAFSVVFVVAAAASNHTGASFLTEFSVLTQVVAPLLAAVATAAGGIYIEWRRESAEIRSHLKLSAVRWNALRLAQKPLTQNNHA